MDDEKSDWMPLHAVIAHVEVTQQCYRERAIDLVGEALDGSKVRSRTVRGPPRWLSSHLDGKEVVHSDFGMSIEVWREDVVRLWPERQGDRPQPPPAQPASNALQKHARPIEEGIRLAIEGIWANKIPRGIRAKKRDNSILKWLNDNEKSAPENIARAVQRVLKAHPELWEDHPGKT